MENLNNINLVLFGAGIIGQSTLNSLNSVNVKVSFFCDNDSSKWEKFINGVKVIAPNQLKEIKNLKIIISSKYYEEMKRHLDSINISKDSLITAEEVLALNKLKFPPDINKGINFPENEILNNIEISIVIQCNNDKIHEIFINRLIETCSKYSYEIVKFKGRETKINGNKIIILKQNDYVQDNWIDHLLSLFTQYSEKCVVGSQIIDTNGKVISAGQIYWDTGVIENFRYGKNYFECESSYVRQVDGLKVNGMLISKNDWIDFLDSMQSEDYEALFCLKMHQKNILIIYQPESVIMSVDDFHKKENVIDLNSNKWKKYKTLYENNAHIKFNGYTLDAIDKKKYFRRMILVEGSIPRFDINAAGRTIDQYIDIFLKMNMQIILLPSNYIRIDKYIQRYQQKGIFVIYGSQWREKHVEYINKFISDMSYAFFVWPHCSLEYIEIFKKNPHIVLSYYGGDIHYMRLMRQYELTHDEKYYIESKEVELKEDSIINQVDFAGFPSVLEVDILKNKFPDRTIQYFPAFYYKEKPINGRNINNKGLLFVGIFAHMPNTDGVLWFANEVLPILRRNGFMEKIYIIGSNPSQEILNFIDENFIVTGYVSDEELENYYTNCKIAIAPLRFGAGIKGKILEALYQGIPIVTTDIGAEAIDIEKAKLIVANTAHDYASAIQTIYFNDDLIDELSIAGQTYAISNFGETQLYDLFMNQVNSKNN